MALNGLFSTTVLGMRSQALALELIGTNVANVNSGGYRRQDTNFATVLSSNIGGSTDNGGLLPNVYQRITGQGQLLSSPRGLDIAISGQGFFVTNTMLDQSGEQLYTRDGSFSLVTANTVTLTDSETQQTFESSESYIVDKNGNYLLGYAAESDGTFPTQGTLVPLRVDQNAFANTGQATTNAELVLNLPSDAATISDHLTAVSNLNAGGLIPDGMETYVIDFIDSLGNTQTARLNFTKSSTNNWEVSATYAGAPVAQVDTVTIGGTFEVNDQYSISVDGFNATYVVQSGDTQASVVAGLVNAVNNNTLTGNRVTTAAGATAGTITLTSDNPGTSFTGLAGATNATATPQVSTLTISGTIEAGDQYIVDVDGNSVTYTVTGSEGSLEGVRNGLIAAINGASSVSTTVTATQGSAAGEITLTGDVGGVAYTVTPSVIDTGATAQVDTITIGSPVVIEAGDTYSATVNGTTVTYTTTGAEAGVSDIRNGLRALINADATISGFATAADSGTDQITITHNNAGGSFTATVVAANGGVTADNSIAIATTTAAAAGPNPNTHTAALTTAAVAPVNDNTASITTTTANDQGLITTGVTQLPFTGSGIAGVPNPSVPGTVTAPSPINFSFSFPASGNTAASTATFALDIDGMTQFAAPFQPRFYNNNGFAAAELQSVSFDNEGHVVGLFANGTGTRLYKIPLAQFDNANGLEMLNGMTFRETQESGQATIQTPDVTGRATFVASTRELSNVQLTDEFTKMIQTQTAYNAVTNAFRTQDEMLELLRDMKR